EYQKLKEHHRQFHAVAAQVVREHQRGRTAQAQALLDGEFTRKTHDTLTAIRALRDAVEGRRRTPAAPAQAPAAPRPAAAVTAMPARASAAAASASDQHWQEF
ncbi:MAG: hypothetical protein K6T33_04280, partial [Thermomonas hydrothermalis]|uniref:hypothetical protein n=1 Tax=Thermomonas hydrothermalis TaxID=213588 RepID=UPI0023532712